MASKENKENRGNLANKKAITNYFKVKKCLFNTDVEFQSPSKIDSRFSPECQTGYFIRKPLASPDSAISYDDGSPFSQYSARKVQQEVKSSAAFEWNTPLKSFQLKKNSWHKTVSFQIATSDSPVKQAVQKSVQNPDLIGDFSKPYCFPTVQGKHPDLKSISPDTYIAKYGRFECHFVDCRYPYEYNGGHIKNALNIFYQDDAEIKFLNFKSSSLESIKNSILIFYCEYSAERAPSMSQDRECNSHCYPQLYYPEIYLIEGGYKAFYSKFKDLCEPQDYQPMHDKEYSNLMAYYRGQCKSRKVKNRP